MAKIYDKLSELGMSQDEAESLRPTVDRLELWQAPKPTRTQTDQVMAALLPLLPRRETRLERLSRWCRWWPLLLLRTQLRAVRREIFWASALIMGLGVLVTLATYQSTGMGTTPFVLVAPIVAGVGIALLYDSEMILEIEQALPVSYRTVLVARLTLVFGLNLMLGFAASVALSLVNSNISLWPLVLAWLAPMTFLSALSFLVSTIAVDALIGMMVSMGLWFFQAMIHSPFAGATPLATLIPNLLSVESRTWLLFCSVVLAMAALVISGREEHWIRG